MHRTFQSPLFPARYISPGSLIDSSGLPKDKPEASCDTTGRIFVIRKKLKIRNNLTNLAKGSDKILSFKFPERNGLTVV